MWYELFQFEIKYRIKRPETYLFFVVLIALSVFGVDFIFQGVELGLVKKNAPIVIGKTMGAITGILMILASMIMGMPIIRDDHYKITDLIYTQPISKFGLLFGRFLGSFAVLLIIFSGIPIGMMFGELLPWHLDAEMLPFRFTTYLSVFSVVVLPILFFGAALFFVTGTLSRKLLVVYTQGIMFFVVFLLTKSITDEYLQAVLDPFSLTTITQLSQEWTIAEKNSLLLPLSGVLLANKLLWVSLGVLALWIGYVRFHFSTNPDSGKSVKREDPTGIIHYNEEVEIPNILLQYNWRSQLNQYKMLSLFYGKALVKETSFWAIVICGVIIISVNSISLGTVYGVDSYPTTYFIVEELQELSIYFFIIILLFYSGELYWKESGSDAQLLTDVTPISSLIILCSKMTGLIGIYIVLMLSLILAGITFQLFDGYYYFDLLIYLSGFFLEILPFLVIYTFPAFFFQALVQNKFLGILLTLVFFIGTISLDSLGFDHVLFNFGGGGLQPYSEMNGYGHYMAPYLWTKIYWGLFGFLLLIIASLIMVRGISQPIIKRFKNIRKRITRKQVILISTVLISFLSTGAHNYYQTNVLNEVWSTKKQHQFRANYEQTLKQFEYLPQPKITHTKLYLELYPLERSYDLVGEYHLHNSDKAPLKEIHIQKLIASDITLSDVQFSAPVAIDSQYQEFSYIIYQLESPLLPGDSITMRFTQRLKPRGFNASSSISSVLHNGTFIRNNEFPTFGYNKKYELAEDSERTIYGLGPRDLKAEIDDVNELRVAQSGSDAHTVHTHVIIGTSNDQTAVTSGNLIRNWSEGKRHYFEYQSYAPMINFYSILSGRYDLVKDKWQSETLFNEAPVDLEIYHHPRHTYNVDRMMEGMKASLDYFTANFSPYQYQQLRIVEFPRYEEFAQSFPNTIPFSESIGFMLDINDDKDLDMAFFITAHEVAHQWWGMQVAAANVKGRNFILETLSQYSALMVFKSRFPQTKVDQFIDLQRDLYEKGRNKSKVKEAPLYLVENEEYIYYNKGAIAMYQLQECIDEENVNDALRSFLIDWNISTGRIKSQTDRYPTAEDLIEYILKSTPEASRVEIVALLKGI